MSWSAPVQSGGSSISDYLIRASSDGGLTWQSLDTHSRATTYALTGLSAAVTRVIEIAAVNVAGIGPWSVPIVGTSSGLAPLQVSVTAPGGSAIIGGAMSWSLDDGSAHSSASYGLDSAGIVTFPAAPGGLATLSMTDAQLSNGDQVSGSWSVTFGIGPLHLVAAQEPVVVSRAVLVQDPSSVAVAGASVSISALSSQTNSAGFSFTAIGAASSGVTGLDGRFSDSGFTTGTPSATVIFDDGVITQSQTLSLTSPLTVVTLAYQPYVVPKISTASATSGAGVSVTLTATSAVGAAKYGLRAHKAAPLAGVQIHAILAAGMKVGGCHAKLMGTTSGAGTVTLRLCATASGLVTFKAVGAYVRGGVKLFVKYGPPLAVRQLSSASPSLGTIQSSWVKPIYLGGASKLTYKIVIHASGQSTITKSTSTTSISVSGLAHATRYTVTVYAVTKYGESLADTVSVGVA